MMRRGESRETSRRAVLGGPVALVLLVVLATAAQAAWAANGTGAHAAVAADLPAPATVTAAASGTTVHVSWSAVQTTGGHPASGYLVTRTSGGTTVAAGGTCAGTVTTTSCAEPGLAGGTHTYTVVAVIGANWRSPGRTSSSVTVVAGSPNFLVELVAPGAKAAGTAFQLRVTARTAAGGTDATVTGSRSLTVAGLAASPNGTAATVPSSGTFASGVATLSVTATRAVDPATITVTDTAMPSRTGSVSVTITPEGTLRFSTAQTGGSAIACPRTYSGGGGTQLFVQRTTDRFGNAPATATELALTITWTDTAGATGSTSIAAGQTGQATPASISLGNNKSATLSVSAAGHTPISCSVTRSG